MSFLSAAGLMRADVTPIGPDATTQGSWNGKYGQDGFLMANGPSHDPPYGSASVSGAATFTWAWLTSDIRGLQSGAGSTTRMAATYYANNFNVAINVSDGNLHPVSLYFLDWDTTSRAQTVTVFDASSNAVLDTENITTFTGGKYFSWNIRGNVRINITSTGGGSAVLSGIFFGINSNAPPPPPGGGGSANSATPIGPDTTTLGSWTGIYGGDGYTIANVPGQQAPPYGSATVTGAATYSWAWRTSDPRGLQYLDPIYGNIRTASTYYGNNFNVNVNLTDGNSHQVSLYMLDFDGSSQGQTIDVYDGSSGALLDTQSISSFSGGKYFSWTVKGNVRFNFHSAGYSNALVSGIFFGSGGTISNNPPAGSISSASFVGLDTTTQGTWTGKYGANGYMIANGNSSAPTYANASVTMNPYNYTWVSNTTDVRALQTSPGATSRIASMYGTYKVSYFDIPVTITDGNAHSISLYLLNWDSIYRPENISIIDASSNQVLDSRNFDGYHDGQYATWNIKGNVVIRITPIGEIYAAVAGVFFN